MKQSLRKQIKRYRQEARLVFTGFSMGIADLVPGVSGGSIALLFGIYDELLESIKRVTNEAIRLLLRRQFKAAWQIVPFRFLVPLFVGIFGAIFGFVRIVEYLLEKYPVYVWSLFFGLILGTVYIIAKRVDVWSAPKYVALLSGAVAVYIIIGLPTASAEANVFTMLYTGAIAICAMILPGISGSLIMLIMGQYENVINAVSDFNIQLLSAFALGAAAGLALFSRLLSWLLNKYHFVTLAFLVGLMIGALRAVWPWKTQVHAEQYASYVPELSLGVALALGFMAVGYWLVLQLEKVGLAQEHDDL